MLFKGLLSRFTTRLAEPRRGTVRRAGALRVNRSPRLLAQQHNPAVAPQRLDNPQGPAYGGWGYTGLHERSGHHISPSERQPELLRLEEAGRRLHHLQQQVAGQSRLLPLRKVKTEVEADWTTAEGRNEIFSRGKRGGKRALGRT